MVAGDLERTEWGDELNSYQLGLQRLEVVACVVGSDGLTRMDASSKIS
jgi:hypothetical protein